MIVLGLALVISVAFAPESEPMPDQDISILLANHEKALVDREAAGEIARIVAERYYGSEIFRLAGQPDIEDCGGFWRVMLRNAVERDISDALLMPAITMSIGKTDGRVLNLSAAPFSC